MYHSAVSPFGGERSEPITRMLNMPYDTESQSRNVLASPLGEEGHEVAKGCTRVRMIMILDVDVTAEGGITKLMAQEGDTTTLGAKGPVSRVDGIRLLCPPLTEPYVRFSRIRLLE